MTIKDFSRLCGCNPKTLRYYDQIGLLKPVRVDEFSGYRHYDEKQALTFVKIKNLQSAGFSIDEIKGLIDRSSFDICAAFDEKIRQQEQRLEKIREIRKSYQAEMDRMNERIQQIREYIEEVMAKYDPGEEFGIDSERYAEIQKTVYGFFEGVVAGSSGKDIEFHEGDDSNDEEEEYLDILNDPEYEVVYETHGWQRIRDISDKLAEHFGSGEQAVVVKTVNENVGTAYAVTLLGTLLDGAGCGESHISCNVTKSDDNTNHVWLLRRK